MRSSLLFLALAIFPLSSFCYTAVTQQQVQDIMPQANPQTIADYLPSMNQAMDQYSINTPERQAAFLGQVAEETGQLSHMTEVGTADGTTYQGRGALQLTGHANYAAASKALGVNFVSNPSLVATPQYAFQTAGWYWDANNLNKYADQKNFAEITKLINGCVTCAVTHYDQRVGYYNAALNTLGNTNTNDGSSTLPGYDPSGYIDDGNGGFKGSDFGGYDVSGYNVPGDDPDGTIDDGDGGFKGSDFGGYDVSGYTPDTSDSSSTSTSGSSDASTGTDAFNGGDFSGGYDVSGYDPNASDDGDTGDASGDASDDGDDGDDGGDSDGGDDFLAF